MLLARIQPPRAHRQVGRRRAANGVLGKREWLARSFSVAAKFDPFQIPQVWQTEVGIGSQALKSSAQRYLRSDQYVEGAGRRFITARNWLPAALGV